MAYFKHPVIRLKVMIMKKTVNVAIGGCSFILEEDAYLEISTYLDKFRAGLKESRGCNDVMDELEGRIADLLKEKLRGREVVSYVMVQEIIDMLGYPEGFDHRKYEESRNQYDVEKPVRRLFRDPDDRKIAGVCSGVALYLGVDVVVIRIIFLVALICGFAGFWIYLVIWIAAPEAKTATEKCELRGIPANAENIQKFTQRK